jgi:hypothetical protein
MEASDSPIAKAVLALFSRLPSHGKPLTNANITEYTVLAGIVVRTVFVFLTKSCQIIKSMSIHDCRPK